jgi:hypothetical protein
MESSQFQAAQANYRVLGCVKLWNRQILDIIGTGYEDLDYDKFIGQRLLCEEAASTVCFPEREAEWRKAQELAGEERRQALEKVANTVHEEVLGLPLLETEQVEK